MLELGFGSRLVLTLGSSLWGILETQGPADITVVVVIVVVVVIFVVVTVVVVIC